MSQLQNFFGASVGAAAALVGLLFVAITMAPERIFGPSADVARRVQASRAFIALGNVFFVSLAALIPDTGAYVIVIIALLSMVQTVREGIRIHRFEPTFRVWRSFGFTSLAIYALQLFIAGRMELHLAVQNQLVYVILGLYFYSLTAAWTLLGGHD
jgi:hypothetical protein